MGCLIFLNGGTRDFRIPNSGSKTQMDKACRSCIQHATFSILQFARLFFSHTDCVCVCLFPTRLCFSRVWGSTLIYVSCLYYICIIGYSLGSVLKLQVTNYSSALLLDHAVIIAYSFHYNAISVIVVAFLHVRTITGLWIFYFHFFFFLSFSII